MKGICNTFCRARVLEITGVSNQRPSRPVGFAKVIRDQTTHKPFLSTSAMHPLGQAGSILRNRAQIVSFNVGPNGGVVLRGKAHAYQGEPVIGHPTERSTIWPRV